MILKHISQIFCLAVLLCLQGVAADLPAWTDDSSVVLRSDLGRIVAGQEQARLTVAVFHPWDAAVRAQFTVTVKDEQGMVAQTLNGVRNFQPGEPMEFSAAFDGRDASRHMLPSGRYTVEATVDLSPASPVAATTKQASPAGAEAAGRTYRIVQRRSIVLEIATAPAAPLKVVTTSQLGQDPAFPFNHYYGTLHTQTTCTDGGQPSDSTCASPT